jgi:predicted RNase H-like HicB family nuclease
MPEQDKAQGDEVGKIVAAYRHVPSGLIAVLHEEPMGGYFALIPALPGCGSQGDSPEETLANLDDALTAVLDVIREDEPQRLRELCGEASATPVPGSAVGGAFVRCSVGALRR